MRKLLSRILRLFSGGSRVQTVTQQREWRNGSLTVDVRVETEIEGPEADELIRQESARFQKFSEYMDRTFRGR